MLTADIDSFTAQSVLSEHHLDVLCRWEILPNCSGGNRLSLLALTAQYLPVNLIGVFKTPIQRQLLLTRLPLLRRQLQWLRLMLRHCQLSGCLLHVLLCHRGLLPRLGDFPLCGVQVMLLGLLPPGTLEPPVPAAGSLLRIPGLRLCDLEQSGTPIGLLLGGREFFGVLLDIPQRGGLLLQRLTGLLDLQLQTSGLTVQTQQVVVDLPQRTLRVRPRAAT